MVKKNTICLNMIVKNESHVLLNTFKNILEHIAIDYWVISDTGSTDGTQDLIKNFFKDQNIKGELYEDKWVDFSTNRNLALKHAFGKTDYLFIFDADDSISGNLKLENLTAEGYYLNFGPDVFYQRLLLINNKKQFQFIGVLHEILVPCFKT